MKENENQIKKLERKLSSLKARSNFKYINTKKPKVGKNYILNWCLKDMKYPGTQMGSYLDNVVSRNDLKRIVSSRLKDCFKHGYNIKLNWFEVRERESNEIVMEWHERKRKSN